MTSGSSQGLFVIVAVIIFGIFVVISYLLFRDKLQTSLASIFKDGVTNTMASDMFFNNSISEKEYVSLQSYARAEFVNNNDWDMTPIIDYFGTDKQYKISFDYKQSKSGDTLFYLQSGRGAKYQFNFGTINGVPFTEKKDIVIKDATTEYKHYEIVVNVMDKVLSTGEVPTNISLIGFWGGSSYDSEVFPTVKNMRVEVVK